MTDIPAKKKRKKPTPLSARALAELRGMGFIAEVVEKRIPHCFITRDFIGCIDILAFRPGIGVLGVQVTSGPNHAARAIKAIVEPRLRTWLQSGGRFEVWSYALRGKRGARKLYQLRRQEITLNDLPAEPPATVEVGDGLFTERSAVA